MNLNLGQLNSSKYKMRSLTASQTSRPLSFKQAEKAQQVSFTGDIATSLNKFAFNDKKLVYEEAERIAKIIDDAVGDEYFTKQLAKTNFSVKNNKMTIIDPGVKTLFFETLKYPFVDLPLDILGGIGKLCKKMNLKGASNVIQNLPFMKKRAKTLEVQKATKFVRDVMMQFAPDPSKMNIEKSQQGFLDLTAKSITTVSKNYLSRDERTLNRMATATVSALYGARDFYNISMLQKDDKKEAKKAQKARFKQEMTRMFISASLTFFSLGVLDKFTKRNLVLNASVIALSSLISEIFSRVMNGVPLRPLSPEDAKKIAQKRKAKKQEEIKKQEQAKTDNSTQKTDNSTQKQPQQTAQNTQAKQPTQPAQNNTSTQFKSKYDVDKLYVEFKRNNTNQVSDKDKKQNSKPYKMGEFKNEKKKIDIKKVFGYAFLLSNLIYFLNRGKKGNFRQNEALKDALEKYKKPLEAFKSGKTTEIPQEALSCVQNALGIQQKTFADTKIGECFDAAKEFLTTKKEEIDLNKFLVDIRRLSKTKEGRTIEPLMNEFIKDIETYASLNGGKLKIKKDIPFTKGLYNGVTKIFKTVYQILSAPTALALGMYQKNHKANQAFAQTILEASGNKAKRDEVKEIKALYEVIRKAKGSDSKAIRAIKNDIRNFEVSSETGELANFSRTLVTIISTYFFVNDYSNKVLIESEGKNVEQARDERNDRIAHKMSNFVINGTLMNTFNSIGKSLLNRSLLGATAIATATEMTNEFLVRKSICQPVGKMNSREEILKYEEEQTNKKGLMGAWSRFFRKITGKKTLTQKAGIKNKPQETKTQK